MLVRGYCMCSPMKPMSFVWWFGSGLSFLYRVTALLNNKNHQMATFWTMLGVTLSPHEGIESIWAFTWLAPKLTVVSWLVGGVACCTVPASSGQVVSLYMSLCWKEETVTVTRPKNTELWEYMEHTRFVNDRSTVRGIMAVYCLVCVAELTCVRTERVCVVAVNPLHLSSLWSSGGVGSRGQLRLDIVRIALSHTHSGAKFQSSAVSLSYCPFLTPQI